MLIHKLLLTAAVTAVGVPLLAETARPVNPTPIAATAPTVVPALVPFAAIAEANDGKPLTGEVTITFLLFKDETGGEPLWTESQRVVVDTTGRYNVQLGAGSPSGLPLTVFASGEARWLEVQIAGQAQQSRVLLSSVPYAAKAADSATLGGLPASAFVLAGTPAAAAIASSSTVSPDAASNVTTTGGTSKYIPKFSGSTTVVNSQIYDAGTGVGIGNVPNASAKLDIAGSMIVRGNTIVSRTGNATSAKGYGSYSFDFFSNIYNSSTHTTDNAYYALQSEPTGNNTSNPSATFNLLFGNNGAGASETGLYFNANGTVHFAPGQTFPGTGDGTITKVTAGTGLSGGGSSGAVTLTNAGILALTAGSGLKSTGGQSPTFTIDTTKIPTLTDNPVFTGNITVNSSAADAIDANATNSYTGISASSDAGHAGLFEGFGSSYATLDSLSLPTSGSGGYALYGYSTGSNGYGLYAEADGAGAYGIEGYAPGGSGAIGVYGLTTDYYGVEGQAGDGGIGVTGYGTNGFGVYGNASTGFAGYFVSAGAADTIYANNESTGNAVYAFSSGGPGVLGTTAGESATAAGLISNGDTAGVWGDTSAVAPIGSILGTADNNYSGFFINNSANYSTLFAENNSTAGTGLFKTLQATSREGTCGIGGGSLSCTGPVKSLVSTNGGARMVETYAMQSPENWMEDFGSGKLSNGVVTVSIDPAFTETANTGADYHVFLTPNGDSKGLYVVARTATTFEVHEAGGGTASLSFDYRIVAKRRGYEQKRLTDVSEAFTEETGAVTRRLTTVHADRTVKTKPPLPAARLLHPGRGPQKQPLRRPVATAASQRHTGN